jgi:hypothetical protein
MRKTDLSEEKSIGRGGNVKSVGSREREEESEEDREEWKW